MTARDRIIQAVTHLLSEGGRDAVSTRAVSSAAGVQPPTIYRQFGDMQGLLDAVTSHGYATYLASHRERHTDPDPVEDLRRGWNLNIDFGLENPVLYTLMYGNPRPGETHPAAAELQNVLLEIVQRVAEAGRLRVGVKRASNILFAAGTGVVLFLIGQGGENIDRTLSDAILKALLMAITTDSHTAFEHPHTSDSSDVIHHAVALKASLSQHTHLFTNAERDLFDEWLSRFIDTELGSVLA